MDPWKDAVQQFSKNLSPEDRLYLTTTNSEDLINDIVKFEESHKQSSKSRRISAKVQPLVSAIADYGKALDVISNSSSVLPPLWGSLRVLILAAKRYEDYFIRLIEMLEHIGDVLPRYSTYAILFPYHIPAQKALKAVYLQILQFVTHAMNILTKSSGRTFAKATWTSFDENFQESVVQLRRHRELVEDEAKLASMIEQMKEKQRAEDERCRAAKSRKQVEYLEAVISDDEKRAAIRWLDASICIDSRDVVQSHRQQGSCQWILDREELTDWIGDSNAQIFWIHGAAGCGKSYLYSKILDHLELRQPTTFFFYCGGDKERSTFSSLLRSWSLQLIEANPKVLQQLILVRRRNGNATATEKEVLELLGLILDQIPSCYLTVDAIDECSDGEEFFRRLSFVPSRFKILVTSRTPADARKDIRHVRASVMTLAIQPEMSQNDIDRFVATAIDDLDLGYSEETKNEIQRRLSRNDGMFLWSKLMLDQITSQTCEYEALVCLDALPDGLPQTYERIMNRINALPTARRQLALKVFFWMLALRRAVSVTELRTLLAVQPLSETFDERRVICNAETMILAVCGGLIQFRHPQKRAFFMHFTVTQYLEVYLKQQQVHQEIMTSYDIRSLHTNDGLAAAVCIRYLSYKSLESITAPQSHSEAMAIFERVDPRTDLLSYAASNWFHHLDRIDSGESYVLDLATRFLVQNTYNREFSWRLYWFSSLASLESVICPAQFSGLHMASYFGLIRTAEKLLTSSSLDLRDSANRCPLWWAASRGYASLVELLLKAGFSQNASDADMMTPVHRAAASGHIDVLRVMFLQATSAETPLRDREGWTPLHWAASRGHTSVVDLILKKSYIRQQYGTVDTRCALGRTPLHLVALSSTITAIEVLHIFEIYGWGGAMTINTQDHQGCTALHLAAMQGCPNIIRKLLSLRADPTILDHAGKDAAQKARMMGNDEGYHILTLHLRVAYDRASPTQTILLKTGEKLKSYDFFPDMSPKFNTIDTQDLSTLQAFLQGHRQTLYRLRIKGRWFPLRAGRGRTGLHLAAALGYARCAEEIVGGNVVEGFIDRQDDRGWTALHYAAVGQFPAICATLLKEGASPSLRNDESLTAFDLAVTEGHQDTLETIARHARLPSEGISNVFGFSKLQILARDGTLSEPEINAIHPRQLQDTDAFGRTALYRATESNMATVARRLTVKMRLCVGELVELSTLAESNGDVALAIHFLSKLPRGSLKHDAQQRLIAQGLLSKMVCHNDPAAITLLLEAGIEIDVGGSTDLFSPETPLCQAIMDSFSEAAICLIRHGANVAAKNHGGIPCLHQACANGLVSVVECLLEHGASATLMEDSAIRTRTPLHAAFTYKDTSKLADSVAIARLLLRHGASLTLLDDNATEPAAWYAVNLWHHATIGTSPPDRVAADALHCLFSEYNHAILLEKADEKGYVSIHRAAAQNNIAELEFQLDNGVPLNWPNFDKCSALQTPLQVAVHYSNFEAAKVLIDRGADIDKFAQKYSCRRLDEAHLTKQDQRQKVLRLLVKELETTSKGYLAD